MENLKPTEVNDVIEEALVTIGRSITKRRLAAGVKQKDMAQQSGVSSSRISSMENGGDCKVSSLISILDALGCLDGVLSAIESGVATNSKRVRDIQTEDDIISEPVKTSRFLQVISRDPTAEIPVSMRTAFVLKDKGFAIRLANKSDEVSNCHIATTVETAIESETAYDTQEFGVVGGNVKYVLTIAESDLTSKQRESISRHSESFLKSLNERLSEYQVRVTHIESSSSKKTMLRSNELVRESKMLTELIKLTAEGMPSV